MVEAVTAAAAYSNTALRGLGPGLESRESATQSFADMVRGMVGSTVQAGQQAEQLSVAAVAGHADLNQVVLAVNNAEIGLQTMVGIRDKIIEAYQEIVRMPI